MNIPHTQFTENLLPPNIAPSSCFSFIRSTRHPLTLMIPHLILFIFLFAPNLHAATVSLTWNANKESDLAGYRIYQRKLSSTDYGSPVFSRMPSNPDSPKVTISNLLEGTPYGFIATAFDTSGNESSPTPEKIITTSSSASAITFPPPISDPAPGATLTATSVTFTGGQTSQDRAHRLTIGTSVGSNNLHDSGRMSPGQTATVSGLPTKGTIYVRWYSKNSSGWHQQDQTYTMKVAQ